MFTLNSLPKVTQKKSIRIGRGEGSNRGKNSGKGHKGQTKHGGKRPIYFTGVTGDAGVGLLSRNPKTKGFRAMDRKQREVFSLDHLIKFFAEGETVDLASMKIKGMILHRTKEVRLVSPKNAENITYKLKFDENPNIYLTKGARELIAE